MDNPLQIQWQSAIVADIKHSWRRCIPVPEIMLNFLWLRTKVRKQSYSYEYSFDGKNYTEIPGTLDAAVLSDDYVLQSYGGFFTGAFVGMACVDYSRIRSDTELTV